MQNSESNNTSQHKDEKNIGFFQSNKPLMAGGIILCAGSLLLGYTVGHRQGLTVVGYDADAEQLVEVVEKQKKELSELNKKLNTSVQERDVAVTNSNDMYAALNQANAEKLQIEGQSAIFREVLRQRGGLSLTVQNLAVKSLPENVYEYQVDLVQVSPNKRKVSGEIEIRLIQGTEVLVVPISEKSFNFDHYQRLTGRWTMPKGFTPQFIEIRVKGSSAQTKRFSWQRGEAIESTAAFAAEVPQAAANSQ